MFGITYSDGNTTSHRGPFESQEDARRVFESAPIMPGQSAYLVNLETGETLAREDGPDEDEG